MPSINREAGEKPRSIAFYVFLGAALFAFIQSYSLLSPILLSFLLVMLISLAVNPLISWIRSLTLDVQVFYNRLILLDRNFKGFTATIM